MYRLLRNCLMGYRRAIIAYNAFWTCFFFVYKLVGYFIFIILQSLQSASNNLIDQLVSDFCIFVWYIFLGSLSYHETLWFDHVFNHMCSWHYTIWYWQHGLAGTHIESPLRQSSYDAVCDITSQTRAERMCHFMMLIGGGGGGGVTMRIIRWVWFHHIAPPILYNIPKI